MKIFFYLIRKIIKDINRKGLIDTVKIYLLKIDTRIFDYIYNVKTHKDLNINDLKFNSINKKEAFNYETVAIFSIKQILNNIDINKNDIFIDFGCGKGRVLLIASQYKFKKIIGIEFSPELVDIARSNVSICKDYNSFNIDIIKIIEGDVLDYKYNNNETVFYLYNPFSNIILDQLCGQIVKSIHHKPRRVYIIYVNPIFDNIIIANGFNKIEEINLINKMCFIYSNDFIGD